MFHILIIVKLTIEDEIEQIVFYKREGKARQENKGMDMIRIHTHCQGIMLGGGGRCGQAANYEWRGLHAWGPLMWGHEHVVE